MAKAKAKAKAADGLVILGMPGYTTITGDADRGFWRATRLPEDRVIHQRMSGSLLANNFNRLWCHALNVAASGKPLRYFAMQHSDVAPQDWWLDTLIDELEATGLDVLGVPAPIKSHDGVTSTALARPDGDTWRPLCRLSTREVLSLPPTFTSDDVGHPLLLNTGLWVCRFDPEWARKVHFTINDRIVVGPDGTYHAEVEPEDWFFSRCLHALGLKVGATRKVTLNHRGEIDFPSDRAWGEPHDVPYVDASVLPPTTRGGFVFPADVDGWLTYDEGKALHDLARGRRVLEIGSYCGRSTVCLAQSAESVVAADPHDGRATPRHKDTAAEFDRNVAAHGLADRVTRVTGTVDDAPDGPYDLIFVDGAHDFASVRHDARRALALLAPGGVLAFHDRTEPGPTAAIRELVGAGARLLSTHDSLAVVLPPAATPPPQPPWRFDRWPLKPIFDWASRRWSTTPPRPATSPRVRSS